MQNRVRFGLIGAALLLCVLILLGGAWFFFFRSASSNSTAWIPAQDWVDAKTMRPAAALYALADENELDALDETLAQGEWNSALALIAYSPTLSDTARIGNLQLVASRLAPKQPVLAARAFDGVLFLATASPEISDVTRVPNLLQAAAGYRTLNVPASQRLAVDLAYLIADHSASIPPPLQARALTQVAEGYDALGQKNLAAQARQRANDVMQSPFEVVAVAAPPYLAPRAALPQDAALAAAVKARTRAARDLSDDLLSGTAPNAATDLIQALDAALTAESAARDKYYQTQLAAAREVAPRLALLRSQVNWLAQKWRIARQGFGLSLVPDWEDDRAGIESKLADALNALFQEEEGTVTSASGSRALEQTLQHELVQSRWGFDRGYDETELFSRLTDASQPLRDAGAPGLFLDRLTRGGPVYLLVPADRFGQGEQALPR